jgi:hypothetical protein
LRTESRMAICCSVRLKSMWLLLMSIDYVFIGLWKYGPAMGVFHGELAFFS